MKRAGSLNEGWFHEIFCPSDNMEVDWCEFPTKDLVLRWDPASTSTRSFCDNQAIYQWRQRRAHGVWYRIMSIGTIPGICGHRVRERGCVTTSAPPIQDG